MPALFSVCRGSLVSVVFPVVALFLAVPVKGEEGDAPPPSTAAAPPNANKPVQKPGTAGAIFSEPAPLAAKALLLDIAKAGDRLVAVGDHGNIVVSTDNGATWIQSLAPTRAMLTGVSFPDAQHGWAVGHDGTILATTDGGVTWTRQQGWADVDTIFLDVLFLDAQRGFVVGAYGKFLTTTDGGKTWTPGHPVEDEIHFNRIVRGEGDALFLAGESGALLVSHDAGKKWTRCNLPYEGSLFAVVTAGKDTVVVGGLRGHILTSSDNGGSWEPHDNDVTALVMGGTVLKDGSLVFGGQGGNFFVSHDAGKSFTHWKPTTFGASVADLVQADDGALIVVGETGAVRLKLP